MVTHPVLLEDYGNGITALTKDTGEGVLYEVYSGEVLLWSRYVRFTNKVRAGGHVFRSTSREQEKFATQAACNKSKETGTSDA